MCSLEHKRNAVCFQSALQRVQLNKGPDRGRWQAWRKRSAVIHIAKTTVSASAKRWHVFLFLKPCTPTGMTQHLSPPFLSAPQPAWRTRRWFMVGEGGGALVCSGKGGVQGWVIYGQQLTSWQTTRGRREADADSCTGVVAQTSVPTRICLYAEHWFTGFKQVVPNTSSNIGTSLLKQIINCKLKTGL